MATTKMTRKGQVTIPAEIRERLHLAEGHVLTVEEIDGKVVFANPGDAFLRSVEKIREYVQQHPPTRPASPEEIDDIVADAVIEEYLATQDDR
jgi:AbrB family looped-hinge helix DNA binding protein